MKRWKEWLEWAYPKPISNILISGYFPTSYWNQKTYSLLFCIIQNHCKVNAAGHNELQQFCVVHCFSAGQWRAALCVRWSTITFRASCSCVAWQPLYWPVDWWRRLELLLLLLLRSQERVLNQSLPGFSSVAKTLGWFLESDA